MFKKYLFKYASMSLLLVANIALAVMLGVNWLSCIAIALCILSIALNILSDKIE